MSYYEAIEELEQDIKEFKSSITQQAAMNYAQHIEKGEA